MSTRLQVVLDEAELGELRAAARERGVTLSQWVRDELRRARSRQSSGNLDAKLAAVREAAAHSFPTAEIDAMLGEIERGRGA